MNNEKNLRLVVALTGASGAVYGIDLLKNLLQNYDSSEIYCVASPAGVGLVKEELGFDGILQALKAHCQNSSAPLSDSQIQRLHIFDDSDFHAPIASGSFHFDAMAISPCSMKTLGKCANSIAENLIVRAAEVALKERRRLVFVVRETPLASTQLRNMLHLSDAGATILPASPAFYQKPKSIADMVNFITARTIAAMGLKQNLIKEWGR